MLALKKIGNAAAAVLLVMLALMQGAYASEIDLKVPSLDVGYNIWGYAITGSQILMYGIGICVLGMVFGFYEFVRIKKMPAHESMLKISNLIYETCKTYMKQQAKLLLLLEIFIAACIFYYFFYLNATPLPKVLTILGWSILGILGSFAVAWFGMRINTYANSRTAFLSLRANPYSVMSLPLRSGMSIGVLLICVELIMMIIILLFVPRESAGACFIGFAIGESLGASALRICGGIFTKIADIGADLMKIIFKIDEDDARNPGVIADCTGDNAGDSVGPTADGFETYGVTGVALISFIVLAAGMMYAPNGELTQMAGGIDIQARLTEGKGIGYEHWAKKFNLKAMAQTLILLQEKDLLNEDDLNQRITELETKYHDALAVVKDIEGRMKFNKELRYHVAAYASTKNIAQQLKTAKCPAAFEEQHRAELTAYRAAAAYFKANNTTKLPSPKKLEAEYAQLASEKAKFYEQYKEAKEELLKLKTAKQNVASFFREEEQAQQER